MIYMIFFILLIFVMVFITKRSQAGWLAIFLLGFYLCTAYPGGNDWLGYFSNYDCVTNNVCRDDIILFEPGYQLLVLVFGQFGYIFLQGFICIISVISLRKFSKYFDQPAFIVFAFAAMFLWTIYSEAVRQALALSIILYSLPYLYNREFKKTIIYIVIAGMFHVTSLVFLLMLVPLISSRLSKILSAVLIVSALVFFVLPSQLVGIVLNILPSGSIAFQKLSFYMTTEQYRPQLSIGSGTILDVLIICVIISAIRQARNSMLYMSKLGFDITTLGVTLYIIFSIIIGKVMPVITRVGWYFFPFVLLLLYINVGSSSFFKKIILKDKINYSKYIVYLFFTLQIMRPFIYEISRYNIINQVTIFQRIDKMDDNSLRKASYNKCLTLYDLNAGFLCTLE